MANLEGSHSIAVLLWSSSWNLEKSTTLLLDRGQHGLCPRVLEERSRVALVHGCAGVEGAVQLCTGPWAEVRAVGECGAAEILGFSLIVFRHTAPA